MKALRRYGPGKMRLVDIDRPVPAFGEVLIRVAAAGVCGSDIHRFHDADTRWDSLVLGHEFSGTVVESGSGVEGVEVGSRVAVAPLIPCHHCDACRKGWYSQCGGYSFIGSRRNGAFAEFVTAPADNLVALPEGLSLERAALLEPITVVLHPVMAFTNHLGSIDTAVVIGLGTIGLLAVQVLRWMGARTIVATDVQQDKIDLALTMGATVGVNAGDEDISAVTDAFGGAQIVFEASGTGAGKKAGIRAAGSRGVVLLVGTSPNEVTIDGPLFERVSRKEISLIGSWMNYSAPWPGPEWTTAAWLLANGHIADEDLITHRIALSDGPRAFDIIRDKSEPFVKILIIPDGGDR